MKACQSLWQHSDDVVLLAEELETFEKLKHESVKLAARCRVKRKQVDDVKADTKVRGQ